MLAPSCGWCLPLEQPLGTQRCAHPTGSLLFLAFPCWYEGTGLEVCIWVFFWWPGASPCPAHPLCLPPSHPKVHIHARPPFWAHGTSLTAARGGHSAGLSLQPLHLQRGMPAISSPREEGLVASRGGRLRKVEGRECKPHVFCQARVAGLQTAGEQKEPEPHSSAAFRGPVGCGAAGKED